MAAKALIAWSAGTVALGATALLASTSLHRAAVDPLPLAALPDPSPVLSAEALPDLVPLPDPPGALAEIRAEVEPPTAQPPAGHSLTADMIFGPPSAMTSPFGLRPAFAALPAGLQSDRPEVAAAAAPSPVQEVIRTVAARDTTLSRLAVLPPPRPSFPVPRVAADPDSSGIVEVTPTVASPAWSEAGPFAAASWPSLTVAHPEPSPFARPERPIQAGMASWYGPGFHGRKTASGEVFNQNALTAAHRSLPFGTKVKVVDSKTGRSVVVRINDRGPFGHGRVIDLSKASAQALGIGGLARVQIVSSDER